MDEDISLERPQRRLLRRLFNGRTTPIHVNGVTLLTFRQASAHILSLPEAEREGAYQAIKLAAKTEAI
ncbi:hypothetical protein [Novosphingobium sp. 9]|uniref:hypothetical protein n=1 Tax=Novosphingobium sp. 9 TaxID=2025349 RepID=UPI0021B5D81F|nr:hypothetical protein [Novosphingobium sp. 9]